MTWMFRSLAGASRVRLAAIGHVHTLGGRG